MANRSEWQKGKKKWKKKYLLTFCFLFSCATNNIVIRFQWLKFNSIDLSILGNWICLLFIVVYCVLLFRFPVTGIPLLCYHLTEAFECLVCFIRFISQISYNATNNGTVNDCYNATVTCVLYGSLYWFYVRCSHLILLHRNRKWPSTMPRLAWMLVVQP